MFFRQRWKDERLRHSLTDNLTLIMGSKQPSDIIWVPDTVFIDSVASKMHSVTVNNHKVDINYDGSVFWGTRVTVSPSCPLNLKVIRDFVVEFHVYALFFYKKSVGKKLDPPTPNKGKLRGLSSKPFE